MADEQVDGEMDGCLDGWVDRRMTDGQMDEQTFRRLVDSRSVCAGKSSCVQREGAVTVKSSLWQRF